MGGIKDVKEVDIDKASSLLLSLSQEESANLFSQAFMGVITCTAMSVLYTPAGSLVMDVTLDSRSVMGYRISIAVSNRKSAAAIENIINTQRLCNRTQDLHSMESLLILTKLKAGTTIRTPSMLPQCCLFCSHKSTAMT